MDTAIVTMFNILGKDYIQGFLLGLTFGALAMLILALYIFSKWHNNDMDRMLKILDIADTKKGKKELDDTLNRAWAKKQTQEASNPYSSICIVAFCKCGQIANAMCVTF